MMKILKGFLGRMLRNEYPTEELVKLGLKVGQNFNRRPGCIIDYSHCWLISVGNDVTFAPRVHVLAHDASTKKHLGYTKIGLVEIGDNVFIGAGAIILPNTKIGNNCIIGAGSIVSCNIPDNSVAVGNPAKVICSVEQYIKKNKDLLNERPIYNESFLINNISPEQKEAMIRDLKSGIGFII